jgi:hypothetical protein
MARTTFSRVLLCRSGGLGPVRPGPARRHVVAGAGRPHPGAAAALGWRRQCAVVQGVAFPPRSLAIVARAGPVGLCDGSPGAAGGSLACPSWRCRTTRASPMPASFLTVGACCTTPRRLGSWRSTGARICTSRQGLSDNAAFNLREDAGERLPGHVHRFGDGPIGIIASSAGEQTAYFQYLPMALSVPAEASAGATFVVQFGGGISTAVALQSGSRSRHGRRGQPGRAARLPRRVRCLRDFTGDILQRPAGHHGDRP